MSIINPTPLNIGFVLYPSLTQLDLTGPWEILTRLPNAKCHLLSHDLTAVKSASGGLEIVPTMTYKECPQLDVICVPGGPGHLGAMEDEVLLVFLRQQAPACRYLMAVCTGTLVLAAAGLICGYRATTHWMSLERLAAFGAEAVRRRIVTDRNRVTGGGVTAGIDLGLVVFEELAGEASAREIQLQIEYEPEPLYGGNPDTAAEETVVRLRSKAAAYVDHIQEIDARAAARVIRSAR
jgi:cyclohexyl-isocyanide hydratase